ncbi:thioredoxin domain-containing protein [Kocuria tytonis]|uniref:Thioredoxin domain-containing protein n=1 Tax=Kocuria tytonis TaxID=2054280 RepID=A0A495A3F4_9MICC|nr:thioredoxin domain-containing protein [Kocuria tytonis]RKQ34125.1 thioredoxin domain-containing protein [Kocuria tytonis]
MSNRLAHATSPYLLQHAENPVDWWEFTPEAFATARERDVPVLLSVGYAACHWCHVMAHESFEDRDTAEYMNAHFVSVKVDREQRPDVDSIYMAATQLLTRQGGWPMTVFLTPEGRAFHAGTYYPPRPVQGRPSFVQVMTAVTEAWTQRRDEVLRSAEQVSEALSRHPELVDRMLADAGPSVVAEPASGADEDRTGRLVAAWLDGLEVARDAAHEGFGTGAKFPPSPALDALARLARPSEGGADPTAAAERRTARHLLCVTLDAMVVGALQDHVGGGFFRYSVTPDWSLPHYEKMLYDNAQLLRVLARTVELLDRVGTDPSRAARYRHAATALVAWLQREMITPEGAFAASLDADSDPAPDEPHAEREGAYYTFSRPSRSSGGSRPEPVTASWGEAGSVTGVLDESVRRALWQRRLTRTAPHRDDKIVTAWNGMALTALAEAGVLLDRPEWLQPATTAAAFLWENHRDAATGTLARTSRGGVVDAHEGQLEDYACLGAGLLALYRATGDTAWYERSAALADTAVARFAREDTVLESAEVDPTLAAAGSTGRAEPFDDVAASSAAILARWLTELSRPEAGGRKVQEVVAAVTGAAAGVVLKAPTAAGGTVSAVLGAARPPELLEVAHASAQQWDQVMDTLGAGRVLDTLVLDGAVAPYGVPGTSEPGFTVWRCRDGRCELPVHSVAQLARRVASERGGDD